MLLIFCMLYHTSCKAFGSKGNDRRLTGDFMQYHLLPRVEDEPVFNDTLPFPPDSDQDDYV